MTTRFQVGGCFANLIYVYYHPLGETWLTLEYLVCSSSIVIEASTIPFQHSNQIHNLFILQRSLNQIVS